MFKSIKKCKKINKFLKKIKNFIFNQKNVYNIFDKLTPF